MDASVNSRGGGADVFEGDGVCGGLLAHGVSIRGGEGERAKASGTVGNAGKRRTYLTPEPEPEYFKPAFFLSATVIMGWRCGLCGD